MTSSTKPEVHNILHCCEKKTEPWLQVACTENFEIFVHIFEYASKQTDIKTWCMHQTDRHTDTLITILRTTTGGEVVTKFAIDSYGETCHRNTKPDMIRPLRIYHDEAGWLHWQVGLGLRHWSAMRVVHCLRRRNWFWVCRHCSCTRMRVIIDVPVYTLLFSSVHVMAAYYAGRV